MLVPADAASEINLAYQRTASFYNDGLPSNFPYDWALAYDDYAKDGIVLGGLNTGGNFSLIETFLSSTGGNDESVILDFAQVLAEYWSTVAVSPGIPAHGGVAVTAVSNDALLKLPLFISAINASINSVKSEPFFLYFINSLEDIAVKSIVWTVIETMPNGAQLPFLEGII